ncbi:MAG: aminotransferase class I/II-fold pyridoxal phosphate-dependent enzyme [Johnsonella sp.]|nr:aminotransferase class I/II-fold pyridoxal phosphate-dependent enzyme [Johnsonella sp.]
MELHGGNILRIAEEKGEDPREWTDFSANINPFGMDESVKAAVLKSLDSVQHYPDSSYQRLCALLAKKHGVKEEEIILGNGALELIYRLVSVLSNPPGRESFSDKSKALRSFCAERGSLNALIPAPSFSSYESAVRAFGRNRVRLCRLNRSFQPDQSYIQALNEDIDIAFLCLPNNPTGTLPEKEDLEEILRRAKQKGILLFADECFLDFSRREKEYSLIQRLREYPNIAVLKSFTKLYAIPGLRLGYLISSNEELREVLRKQTPCWAISSPAAAAGEAALLLDVTNLPGEIAGERNYLKEELCRLGCRVWESEANFLFFYREQSEELYEKLLQKKIIIRKCDSYHFLDRGYYRIAVRKRYENKK